MPNLLLDFAKGFGSSLVPQSISELKSDAENIKDTLMTGGRTAVEKYREIRNSAQFKKVTDSLFHRSDDLGQNSVFDNDDDDFDAGFQFGADAKEDEPKAKVLDYESMKDIAKGQVSSMYEIAGKQTEASAMTASEIISTMNTRSSEIIASLGNINSSLTSIGSKLDKLIELTTISKKQQSRNNGPFDASGNLTFGSVFNFAKSTASDKLQMIAMPISMLKSFLSMGSMGGESTAQMLGSLAGMIPGMFGDKIKIGGKTYEQIQEDIDTKIANAQNNLLTKLLNNKLFKKLFGDHTSRRANQDYSLFIENQYNRDKAVFDGMTRKTIIDIIPGYLRRITEAVTGQTLWVSSEGTLTTERESGFANVLRGSITSGFNTRYVEGKRVSSGTKLDSSMINKAQRIFTYYYINHYRRKGTVTIPQEEFEDGGIQEINDRVVDALARNHTDGKSRAEWQEAVDFITSKLLTDKSMRTSFVITLQQQIDKSHNNLKKYAQNAHDTHDIGPITDQMIDDVANKYLKNVSGKSTLTYGELIEQGLLKEEDMPKGFKKTDSASAEAERKADLERMRQSEVLGSIGDTFKKSTDTTLDYVASIFEILNRGINVFAVNGSQKKAFGKMHVKHISSTGTSKPSATATVTKGATVNPPPAGTGGDGGGTGGEQQGGQGQGQSDTGQQIKDLVTNPLGKVSDIISGEINKTFDDLGNVVDRGKSTASIEVNKALAQNEMNSADTDQEDRDIANAVLQAMTASAADGDTKEDMAALSTQISEIKNPKLKARLNAIVEGTLKRSDSKKPASSKLGKILTWGWGIVKTAFGGFIGKAKTFVTSLGKTLLAPIINSLKSSGNMIVRGGQSIKEGFMGSDESAGLFGRFRNYMFGEPAGENDMESIGKADIMKAKASNAVNNIGARKGTSPTMDGITVPQQGQGGTAANPTMDSIEVPGQQGARRSGFMDSFSKLGDKFKQTEFGQGFMSAFESKREMKPQTLADQSTKGIFDLLKSKDGKSGAGETVLSRMLSGIMNLKTVFENGVKSLEAKSTGSSSGSGSTSTTTNTGGTEMPSIGGGGESAGGTDLTARNIPAGYGSTMPTTPAGVTPSMPSIDSATTMPGISATDISAAKATSAATSGAAAGAAASAGKKGIGFDLGKILGGMSGILMGIAKAVLTVVLSMAAVKKIMDLGMKVLKTALQPLNKAFQKLYTALKPLMATVAKVLKQIIEYVVQIVEAVVEFIKPLLEAIGPLLEQIMDILNPILEMITGLVEILLVPLTAILQTVVVPVLRAIGNTLEILLGIVQVGLGIIITAIGGVLMAVGTIVKWLTSSDSTAETGKKLFDMGTNMTKSGAHNVVDGMKKSVTLAGETWANVLGVNTEEDKEEETRQKKTQTPESLNTSPMEGLVGAGDADYSSIYGGYGAQSRYGNYLNMSQRGCGPVALADAYSRRSGSAIDPRGLATAMSSAGAYNPSAGTSVQGYINASRSMGMNLTPGGVTVGSLRQATPDNPITVIGSGTDYTTRRGNNHFMNVVGSSGGTAFVSNPMTGRVERRSMSSLASSSVLGLYGSGNAAPAFGFNNIIGAGDDNAPYKFSDEVQDALSNLKSIVGNIISMFTGGSETDRINESLDKATNEEKYKQAEIDASGLSDEERSELDAKARELFEKESPRFEGETDAEYNKRFERNKKRYWTMAATEAVRTKVKSVADGSDEGATKLINYTLGDEENPGFMSNFAESMTKAADDVESGGFQSMMEELSGGYWDDDEYFDSGFYSDKGARLYTDEYDPSVFENDATGWTDTAVPNTIMGEWMDKMLLGTMMSSPFRWRGRPVDKDAEGTNDGRAHAGVDFTLGGEIPILATTDGEVIGTAKTSYGDGYGTFVKIKDEGGDIHLYAHMREDPGPMVEEGDYVYGGDQLGIMGNTGESYGQHLHYEIRDGETGEIMNPHSFFHWEEGSEYGYAPYGEVPFEGDLESGNAWPNYQDKAGVDDFIDTAFSAGLTGPEVATITSTGIWEDGGEKLWGDKSLIATTYDSNGQRAQGIMNWVDKNVDYGDTVEEQLQYIQRVYFDGDSDDFRAKVRHTDYDDADLAAFKVVTGREGWDLDWGDAYGPYMNESDLIEGSEHFFRGALVPACIHTTEGPAKYIGTAVGVYNWLLDEGWIDPEASGITGLNRVNRTRGASLDSSSIDSSYDWSGSEKGGTSINATSAEASGTAAKDKTSMTIAKIENGKMYNAAGEVLASCWKKTNTPGDNTWRANKSEVSEWIYTAPGTGTSTTYLVADYPLTIAGQLFRQKVTGNAPKINIPESYSTPITVTTYTPAKNSTYSEDAVKTLRKTIYRIYNGAYTKSYINGLSVSELIDMGNSGYVTNAAGETYQTWVDKSTLKVYLRGRNSWGEVWVKPNGSLYVPTQPTGYNYNMDQSPVYQQYMKDQEEKRKNQEYMDSLTRYTTPPEYDWDTVHSMMNEAGMASGDVPSGPEFVMNTTMSSTADVIPQTYDTGYGYGQPVIVNQYSSQATSTSADSRINAILSNTYNVRSVQIENKLEEMLKLMREKNQQRRQRMQTKSNQSANDQFSDKGIPQQVERLSVG